MSKELPNLDVLRALAVTLVVLSHLLAYMNVRGMGDLGRLGVLFFFVHTSLVLMMSMARMGTALSELYRTFLVRRFFRIYPLSVFVVILFIGLHIPASWIGGYLPPGWKELLANLFLVQNTTQSPSVNCALWSLPFEIQMYLVLPLIFRQLKSRGLWTAIALWFFGVFVSTTEYFFRGSTIDHDFLLARYVPCFLAGVFAWAYMNRGNAAHSPRFSSVTWLPALLLFLVGYRALDVVRVYGIDLSQASHGHLRSDHVLWTAWPPFADLVRDWGFCALIGVAIPLFRQSANATSNFLAHRIAKYSYGIYVIHILVYSFVYRRLHIAPSVQSAVIAMALTGVSAILLYHLLEKPAIRISKRFGVTCSHNDGFPLPIFKPKLMQLPPSGTVPRPDVAAAKAAADGL